MDQGFSRRRLIAACMALPVAACTVGGAGPWRRHDPRSTAVVDHRVWQVFLDRNSRDWPDGITRVDYRRVSGADRDLLEAYVAEQSAIAVGSLARREQLAYWLNLYNALVARLVLDHPIVRSPDDIDIGGVFSRGPWSVPLVSVDGQPVSLDGIGRQVLAPVYQDPRWLYGLCDGTLGAPGLRRRAFTGGDVDRRLEDAAIEFVNHPRAVSVDPTQPGTIRLNALWRRHMVEFGGGIDGVFAGIDLYADPAIRSAIEGRPRVIWMDDRRLNDARV